MQHIMRSLLFILFWFWLECKDTNILLYAQAHTLFSNHHVISRKIFGNTSNITLQEIVSVAVIASFQRILHSSCFVNNIFLKTFGYFRIEVIHRLILITMIDVVAETCHQFWCPTETVTPDFVEHVVECLLAGKSVVHHVDKDSCADDALVNDDAPVVAYQS